MRDSGATKTRATSWVTRTGSVLGLILTLPALGACQSSPTAVQTTGSLAAQPIAATDAERDCLGRAMYFESNRSDREGLLAVGTVVMNRVQAAPPGSSICSVVGQPRQFAPGVLTKAMAAKDLPKVAEVADAVLDGQRHPKVGRAMHFHTAGLRFPYNNMHYVAAAGGNVFYEKRKPGSPEPMAPSQPVTAMAYAPAAAPSPIQSRRAERDMAERDVPAAQTILNEPAKDICRTAGLAMTSRGG
jgi:spore germination cell wall hydrolase CwlJ-like protein